MQNLNKIKYNFTRSDEVIESNRMIDRERKRNERSKEQTQAMDVLHISLKNKKLNTQNKKRGRKSDNYQIQRTSPNDPSTFLPNSTNFKYHMPRMRSISSEKGKRNTPKANDNKISNVTVTAKENASTVISKNTDGGISRKKRTASKKVSNQAIEVSQIFLKNKNLNSQRTKRDKKSDNYEIQCRSTIDGIDWSK